MEECERRSSGKGILVLGIGDRTVRSKEVCQDRQKGHRNRSWSKIGGL